MATKNNKKIKKAVEIIDTMSMDPNEWELYRSRQMAIQNYNISMRNSEKKGEERGLKKGRKIGEKEAKEEIAIKLLNLGIEIDKIVEATELTEEEINLIKKN